MPRKGLSKTKKEQLVCEAYEDLKAHAIKAYVIELKQPKGKGARTVVKDFVQLYKAETGLDIKLSHVTLIWGAARGKSCAKANAARSLLTDSKVAIVIAYIGEVGNHGFPLSHQRLREHVNKILCARLGVKFPTAGLGK